MGIVAAIMTSQVLSEKVGVVFGVANKRSIAWAIAKAWAAAGARLIFNYQGERLKENVADLVGEFGENVPLFPCDVSSDEEIAKFFQEVRGQTDRLDLLLHSVAFAPKEALEGDFVSTTRSVSSRPRHQRLFPGRAGAGSSTFNDEWRKHCRDDLLWR
jgi:enoyl-[acyl-carrier protein] reductase I